jgi:ribosomal protein S27AE
MMADLPAYTGPGGYCPKCGAGGVLTEHHWAGGALGPKKMSRREPPCKDSDDLAAFGGEGEHLCRLCANCGYGWVEACTDNPSSEIGQLRSVSERAED